MALYPGQQVVCVSARPILGACNWYLHMLEEGHVYTVREIAEHPAYIGPGYGVRLEGVCLPRSDVNNFEETWHPARFRPCVKTDIGIFTAMLEDIPAGQDLEHAAAQELNKTRVEPAW